MNAVFNHCGLIGTTTVRNVIVKKLSEVAR